MRACRRASPQQLHDAEEGVVVVTAERKDRVTAAAVVAIEAEERAVVVATAAEGKEHASAAAAHWHRVSSRSVALAHRPRAGGAGAVDIMVAREFARGCESKRNWRHTGHATKLITRQFCRVVTLQNSFVS